MCPKRQIKFSLDAVLILTKQGNIVEITTAISHLKLTDVMLGNKCWHVHTNSLTKWRLPEKWLLIEQHNTTYISQWNCCTLVPLRRKLSFTVRSYKLLNQMKSTPSCSLPIGFINRVIPLIL